MVIANPRRERPVSDDDEAPAEIACRRRHLWRADIGLFWFEGDPDPITLLELGTQLGNPIPMAVGVSPDFACRAAVRAHVGHALPRLRVHDTLEAAVSAAAELVQDRAGPPVRLPHHDRDPGASAISVQLAVAWLTEGPGLAMRLNELVIEVGCAAGNGIDPGLLARVYASVDRLRLDPDDPLGWAEILDAGHALDEY